VAEVAEVAEVAKGVWNPGGLRGETGFATFPPRVGGRASMTTRGGSSLAAAAVPGEAASARGTVVRLFALVWRYRAGCLAILALNFVEVAFTVGGVVAFGTGVDFLSHRQGDAGGPFEWGPHLAFLAGWEPLSTIGFLAGAMACCALAAMGVRFAVAVLGAHVMQRRLVVDLRARVYDKLQRLSFRFFDANETGTVIQRVTTDVQGAREFVEVVVLQTVIVLVSLVMFLVVMLGHHVPLTFACLAATPLMWLLAVRFSAVVRPAYLKARALMDRLVRHLVESVQGVHVVKGFAIEDRRVAGFEAANAVAREQKLGIFRRVSGFISSVHFLMQANMVVLLGFGGFLLLEGEIGLGTLMIFAGLLEQFSMQINQVANITNSMQNSLTGAARMFEILDAPVEVEDAVEPRELADPRGRIAFERVSFHYRDGSPVLEEVSFEARPGECIAILGATGAGKSTLLSLIPRFYDPTAGRILLDGVDLRELRLEDLRRQVGVVFQESFLFSTTVADNIAFGKPWATREQVVAAARVAAAHEFVEKLADGFDTVIGERGADLSGGQRQRLAIARAVLADPRILLLDDATAAIDPETEGEILTAMDRAMEGRTSFVVAHRLSTLRRADRVVVLERGRVVQVGTHDELMAAGGRYRQAADLQTPDPESKRLLAKGAEDG